MRYSGFSLVPDDGREGAVSASGALASPATFRAAQHGESHPVARGRRLRDGSRAAQQPHDARAPFGFSMCRSGSSTLRRRTSASSRSWVAPSSRAPGSRTACYQGRMQPRLLRDSRGHGRLQRRCRRPPRLGGLPRDYLGAPRLTAGGVADDLEALEVYLLIRRMPAFCLAMAIWSKTVSTPSKSGSRRPRRCPRVTMTP